MTENKSQKKKESYSNPAISFGTNIAVGMFVFVFLGFTIDKKIGLGQKFTLFGFFLGTLYFFYELWKIIRQGSK